MALITRTDTPQPTAAPEEFEGEKVKAFGRDFFTFDEFFSNVAKGDLIYGVVENYHRTKDTFKTIGAFVRLVGSSLSLNKLNGRIPLGYAVSSEEDSFESLIPLRSGMVFRVQSIDTTGDKPKIGLSLPSFKVDAKPYKPQVRPNFERAFDKNAPIDNTGVVLEEGDHDISIGIPDFTNPKARSACDNLRSSIEHLEKKNDSFREALNVEAVEGENIIETKTRTLINGVAPVGMPTVVFSRNLTFSPDDDKWPISYMGMRFPRTPGDWMDTELKLPMSKTLLFTGRTNFSGKGFSVDHVSIIASDDEPLPYEVEVEIINNRHPNEVQHPFIDNLLGKMVSLTKYTDIKLTEWTEYLDWAEKIAKLQIKGNKYIDVQVNREDRLLEFTLLFKDKDTFDTQKKILKRPELTAYSSGISTKQFEFNYSEPDFKAARKIKNSEIGKVKGLLKEFSYSEGGNELNISTELQEEILKVYSNPYFAVYAFHMDDGVIDELDRKIKLFEGEEGGEQKLNDFIQESILSKYMFNKDGGFLALSAVGEIALINRLRRTIRNLKNGDNLNPHLGEWLFDATKARLPGDEDIVEIDHWLNPDIANNPNQREAVIKILRTKDLGLLQGPPGNGKTTIIAEVCYQFAIRGMTVLLASQSNDAVNNALEKLHASSKIRAVRLNNKRMEDEDANEIPSEENCLKYFYQNVANDVSKHSLEKWEKDLSDEVSLQKDLRDFQLKNGNINRYQQELTDVGDKLAELYSRQDELFHNMDDARKINGDALLQKNNLEKFLRKMDGEDVDFSLFDEQLNIAEEIVTHLNDDNFTLSKENINGLNNHQRNQYMMRFLDNASTLKKMLSNAKASKENANIADDLKVKELSHQIGVLQDRQNETESEDEFSELGKQITSLKFEIKKLTKNSGVTTFALNENQKAMVSEELFALSQNNTDHFISLLEEKVAQLDDAMTKIRSNLETHAASIKLVDDDAIQKNLDSIVGQIDTATEDRNKLVASLQAEQEFLNELRQKYGLDEAASNESLKTSLDNQLQQVQQRIHDSQKERDAFENLLKGFKSKLDRHAADKRQMKVDTDLYGEDYTDLCNVVGISCTADPRALNNHDFDVVIIDEVSKATAPELLLPISRARKTILVGDHRQLPPMFKTNERSYNEMIQEIQESDDYSDEEKELLSEANFRKYKNMVTASLFKDMFLKAPSELKATLQTHYRCHPQIMNIFNFFYNGTLVNGLPEDQVEVLKAHNLTIPGTNGLPFITPQKHAYWIDSSTLPNGEAYYENHPSYTTSCCNLLEEAITLNLLQKINDAAASMGHDKKNPMKVAVISFYQAQVNNTRKKVRGLHLDALSVAINTVDRFQGQEKGIVIVNLVRNKPASADGKFHVGEHVLAYERINVAFSRAQNLLFVVGAKNFFENLTVKLPTADDTDVISTKVYQHIIQYLYRLGCVFPSSCVLKNEAVAEITAETEKLGCQMVQKPRYKSKKTFRSSNYRNWRR